MILSAAAVLMCCRSASPAARPAPADLVLRGGRIVTLADSIPDAEALAARGGRIVALGPAARHRTVHRRDTQEGAYAWQKMIRAGAIVGNGTDAPVESVDPVATYYAAVTRRTQDGRVFYEARLR